MNEQERKRLYRGNLNKWDKNLKRVWEAYGKVPEEDKTPAVFYYRSRNIEGNFLRTHVRTFPFHRFFVEFIALIEHQRPNEVYSSRERADLEDYDNHPITSSTLIRPYSTVPAEVEEDRYEILVGVSKEMRDVYEYYRGSTSGTQWTPLPVAGVGRGGGSAAVQTTSASTASTIYQTFNSFETTFSCIGFDVTYKWTIGFWFGTQYDRNRYDTYDHYYYSDHNGTHCSHLFVPFGNNCEECADYKTCQTNRSQAFVNWC